MSVALQGIYAIRNLKNGKTYVGSSANVRRRVIQHISKLNRGGHHSQHLQAAWNLGGKEKFSFFLLEQVDDAEALLAREQFWVDMLDTNNPEKGYTRRPIVSTRAGIPQSEETRRKISEAGRGRVCKEETRLKRSIALKGRKFSPETLRRMSDSHKGKRLSESAKAKVGAASKGRAMSAEARKAISRSRKGMMFSEEHRRNLSKATKAHWERKRNEHYE